MRRLLLAVVVAFGLLPAASAIASPFVVVWSGGLEPGSAAVGVVLREDGSGQRLSSDESGHAHVDGSFAPRGGTLSAIRSAAGQVLAHAPSFTSAKGVADGSYVTVAVQDGSRRKFVIDANKDSGPVTALLHRLDVALPKGSRVSTAEDLAPPAIVGVHARAAAFGPGGTGVCLPGESPVHVEKHLSLSDAIAAGVVTGTRSKGVAGGDATAVDAEWKDVAAPAVITIDAEVSTDIPGFTPQDAADRVYGASVAHDHDYTIAGQGVTINWRVTPREPGSSPRACAAEIFLTRERDANGNPSRSWADQPVGPVPGNMHLNESSSDLPQSLMHETGHMAFGLGDTYSSVVHTPIGDMPIGDLGHLADVLLDLAHVDPSTADVVASADPAAAAAHDIMNDSYDPQADFLPADLAPFLEHATIAIHADPGQILVNKNSGGQNLGIGSPFDVKVPPGKSVHEDGIVAYCLDLVGHETPLAGTDMFDVLPKAGALGGEGMEALQRVLDVIAARQPGPLEETPGANAAVWRVTDNLTVDPGDEAAASILQAAGVPLDADDHAFATPHFVDPAASIPYPVALSSPTNPVPVAAPPAPKPARGAVLRGSKLTRLLVTRRRLPAPHGRVPVLVFARVTLAGTSDRVALSLTRRHGHRTVTVARARARSIRAGQASLLLSARHLKPGSYRLLVRGRHSGSRTVAITLTKPRRR